jgi:two-component system sensor histidine kinase MtrB
VIPVRLTLRWRVAIAFGAGLALVMTLLAIATWHLTTGYMLSQREQGATRQTEANVRLITTALRRHSDGLSDLMTGLTTGPDSTILVDGPSGWLTSGRQIAPENLPRDLVSTARSGVPARQRFTADGVPVLGVAMPLAADDSVYVELYSLAELDRTFHYLSILLVAGTAVSALIGIALGAWAGQRALRPLTALTAAASRVAKGDLTARLPEQDDPDLAPLAVSFNTTAAALESRVKQDARFASDVSHELRSPLTTMINVADVLDRRRDAMPAPAQQALRLLRSELHRFRHTVVDLLEISVARQEEPEDDETELVDLGELARNVVASRPGCAVPVEAAPDTPLVRADRRRLDRVVANLLDNADRYGGGAVAITLGRRGRRARLEVDDAGPGVPPELRERIFERFARGLHTGRRGPDGGSGLGLAIVADHVHRHGGTVQVDDHPSGGARFVVELPEAP